MQSDGQAGTGVEEFTLDDAVGNLSLPILNCIKIADSGIASYLEAAYELTWSEAADILEILEIRDEMERREQIKRNAQ